MILTNDRLKEMTIRLAGAAMIHRNKVTGEDENAQVILIQ